MIKLLPILQEIKLKTSKQIEEIPDGWNKDELDPKQELDDDGDGLVASYWAPMDGWDINHTDSVMIFGHNNKFKVETYVAYGDTIDEGIFGTYQEAKLKANEVMNEIVANWDNEEY